eukprot:TRINITY_DN32081_c0_g2_i1.p1 TRINITY_DN32081_c0_g2~~TRINITY_DN32081_c0_g2_i1.p1  ORF type:complete len:145 (-),score=20.90 TRINITY_DN32081_c0_g2_i1:108-494(-)
MEGVSEHQPEGGLLTSLSEDDMALFFGNPKKAPRPAVHTTSHKAATAYTKTKPRPTPTSTSSNTLKPTGAKKTVEEISSSDDEPPPPKRQKPISLVSQWKKDPKVTAKPTVAKGGKKAAVSLKSMIGF